MRAYPRLRAAAAALAAGSARSPITAGAAMTRPSRSPSTGPILTSKYENPHATITVKARRQGLDRDARADLPHDQSRRHREMVAVGKTVSAYGYASTVEKDEMRAERITVDGKTVEMR